MIEPKAPVTEAMKELFHAACDGGRQAVTQILDLSLFETWVDWHANVDVRLRSLRFGKFRRQRRGRDRQRHRVFRETIQGAPTSRVPRRDRGHVDGNGVRCRKKSEGGGRVRFVASGKVYLTDRGAEIVWERPADKCEWRTREILEGGGVAVADALLSIDREKKASFLALRPLPHLAEHADLSEFLARYATATMGSSQFQKTVAMFMGLSDVTGEPS